MLKKKYTPVVIIGAPRSGTNMLRDILCQYKGVATWPCDEVNYIWRHGNAYYSSDVLPAEKASKSIKKYIIKQFDWVSRKYNATIVIEKTCANSLRIPFVNAVLQDAKYIFIIRDGVDTISSSRSKWNASFDISYILKKTRFIPLLDLPYYATKYFFNRLHGLFSSNNSLKFWGPNLDRMTDIIKDKSLNEICALQWKECVESAEKSLSKIDKDKVLTVYYEELVQNPLAELNRIISFIGLEATNERILSTIKSISVCNIGKGRSALSHSEITDIESIIAETLKRHGYPRK
tara:strand:+ start:49 stop:921 length:873 start_codon:yes stop_codon:yes gene_type:complete